MKTNRYLLVSFAILMAMAACNLPFLAAKTQTTDSDNPSLPPTLAAQPEQPDAVSCLTGSWQIVDLSSYVLASIPPETIQEYNLEYQGTSGSMTVRLDPGGAFQMDAQDFKLEFRSKVAFFTVPLTVSLNGTATGTYRVEGSTITTENMDTSGLSASADAAGQQVIEPAQIIQAIPMLQSPYNSADFICSGDAMQLTIHNYPEGIPPLVFERVGS